MRRHWSGANLDCSGRFLGVTVECAMVCIGRDLARGLLPSARTSLLLAPRYMM